MARNDLPFIKYKYFFISAILSLWEVIGQVGKMYQIWWNEILFQLWKQKNLTLERFSDDHIIGMQLEEFLQCQVLPG